VRGIEVIDGELGFLVAIRRLVPEEGRPRYTELIDELLDERSDVVSSLRGSGLSDRAIPIPEVAKVAEGQTVRETKE
jgi:hypothetical protein